MTMRSSYCTSKANTFGAAHDPDSQHHLPSLPPQDQPDGPRSPSADARRIACRRLAVAVQRDRRSDAHVRQRARRHGRDPAPDGEPSGPARAGNFGAGEPAIHQSACPSRGDGDHHRPDRPEVRGQRSHQDPARHHGMEPRVERPHPLRGECGSFRRSCPGSGGHRLLPDRRRTPRTGPSLTPRDADRAAASEAALCSRSRSPSPPAA